MQVELIRFRFNTHRTRQRNRETKKGRRNKRREDDISESIDIDINSSERAAEDRHRWHKIVDEVSSGAITILVVQEQGTIYRTSLRVHSLPVTRQPSRRRRLYNPTESLTMVDKLNEVTSSWVGVMLIVKKLKCII